MVGYIPLRRFSPKAEYPGDRITMCAYQARALVNAVGAYRAMLASLRPDSPEDRAACSSWIDTLHRIDDSPPIRAWTCLLRK